MLAALGSTMNNKYAEGYPGRRYYGGCEFVDVTEQLAIDRAKELFGADHANVQPHAGAQANMAVFGAFLEPATRTRRCSGMVLAHGGHLTHGSPVNVSGMWFNFVGYEVDRETEQLDMDRVRDLAKEHRPKIILAGYTAYPRDDRLRGVPRDRRRGRRAPVGRRLALHRPGRRRRVPVARALRRRRHVHHAQGPARPARRDDPVQGGAREGDRQGRVPDDAGRPAGALHRRQGRLPEGGVRRGLQGLRDPHRARRARPRRRARRTRGSASCPAGPTRT